MDYKAYKEWERKRQLNQVPPHHGKVTDDDGSIKHTQRDRHGNS